tara:strand:- start:3477 stop:3710 length:234 start_codon:yes stop_codon:yes gene_type:complete
MNEHTWEKLDADMRSDMAEEYIQERCPHEDVHIDDFEVINNGENVLVHICCDRCGKSQEHTLDIYAMLDDLDLRWEE